MLDNKKHRNFDRTNCWGSSGPFSMVVRSFAASVPLALKHCIIPVESLAEPIHFARVYNYGAVGGAPRPKLGPYHLMNNEGMYSQNFQNGCSNWNPRAVSCCSIDVSLADWQTSDVLKALNNKVVALPVESHSNTLLYVWGGRGYDLIGKEMHVAMGFPTEEVVQLSKTEMQVLYQHQKKKSRIIYEGFPEEVVFKVKGGDIYYALEYKTLTPLLNIAGLVHPRHLIEVEAWRLQLLSSKTASDSTADCLATFDGPTPRWEIHPWNQSWVLNPNPWIKLDYIIPYCNACNCSPKTVGQHMASRSWKLSELIRIIEATSPESIPAAKYVVNFGAAGPDFGLADPTIELFQNPDISGLLVDGEMDGKLFSNYPLRNNIVIQKGTFINSHTAVELLVKNHVPKHLTVIKIDINCWECHILESLLESGYSSVLFHVKFNPTMPPPLRFKIEEDFYNQIDPPIWEEQSFFYGCTLSLLADILIPAGYHLLEVDGWDATFIQKKVAKIFEPLPSNPLVADFVGHRARSFMVPRCFDSNQKVTNEALMNLCHAVRIAKSKNIDSAILELVQQIHLILEQAAPIKKDTQKKVQFYIAVEGPSDKYYEPRCLRWK